MIDVPYDGTFLPTTTLTIKIKYKTYISPNVEPHQINTMLSVVSIPCLHMRNWLFGEKQSICEGFT